MAPERPNPKSHAWFSNVQWRWATVPRRLARLAPTAPQQVTVSDWQRLSSLLFTDTSEAPKCPVESSIPGARAPFFLPFLEDGKCALTLEQYAEVRSSETLGQASQRLARLSLECSLHQECGPTFRFCSSWVLYGFGGKPLSALGFVCEPRQSRQTPQEVLSLCDSCEAFVVGLGP